MAIMQLRRYQYGTSVVSLPVCNDLSKSFITVDHYTSEHQWFRSEEKFESSSILTDCKMNIAKHNYFYSWNLTTLLIDHFFQHGEKLIGKRLLMCLAIRTFCQWVFVEYGTLYLLTWLIWKKKLKIQKAANVWIMLNCLKKERFQKNCRVDHLHSFDVTINLLWSDSLF